MEQRTDSSISIGTKLGLFWGTNTIVTITSLHKALQVYYKSLPVTTPACIWGHAWGIHVRRLSRRSHMSFLEAVMYVVSWGNHVCCLSRWSCTSSLEAIAYVVSQGDHVRRLSRRSRTSSLMSNLHLKRGWRIQVICALYEHNVLLRVLTWWPFCLWPSSLDASISFVRHGYTYVYTCTHVHVHAYRGTGTGAGMYTYNVLLTVLAWRPFCFMPFNCFSISLIIFIYWISFEGGSNQIFNLVGLPHS